MLGTRITSFAFGFACASGISMYKLKEEIWSSHKILADQVRPLTRADPDCRAAASPRPDGRPDHRKIIRSSSLHSRPSLRSPDADR